MSQTETQSLSSTERSESPMVVERIVSEVQVSTCKVILTNKIKIIFKGQKFGSYFTRSI